MWCAKSDHFRPLIWTALKSLTNYSAAMKSSIRRNLNSFTFYNHRTNRLSWKFFPILLLNNRSRAHKLCPWNFQKIQILT